MCLRNSIFSLCKRIQKEERYQSLRQLMHDLQVAPNPPADSGRSDFGYVARKSNNQFYGYLFTDEHIEEYKAMTIFKSLSSLHPNEKQLIAQGQASLNLFIDACLADLKGKYPHIALAVNPYARYKPIHPITEQSYLSPSDIAECVSAFKNSPAHGAIMNSPISALLTELSETEVMQIVGTMSKDISETSPDSISEDITTLSLRWKHAPQTPQTLLFYASCMMIALRDMLRTACQLLFVAFVGGDLLVINNENVFRIDARSSSCISKYMTVLVQGSFFSPITGGVGNVLLIDCDPFENEHIHEFGFLYSESISFSREMGATSKLTFVLLDEHLNSITCLDS